MTDESDIPESTDVTEPGGDRLPARDAPAPSSKTRASGDEASLLELRAAYAALTADAQTLVGILRALIQAQADNAAAVMQLGEACRNAAQDARGLALGVPVDPVVAPAPVARLGSAASDPGIDNSEPQPDNPSLIGTLPESGGPALPAAVGQARNGEIEQITPLLPAAVRQTGANVDEPAPAPAAPAESLTVAPRMTPRAAIPGPVAHEAAGADSSVGDLATAVTAGSRATAAFAQETFKACQSAASGVQELAQQLAALREQLANTTSVMNATLSNARQRSQTGGNVA